MRILAGGPARETESVLFKAHLEGLKAQAVFRATASVGERRALGVPDDEPDPLTPSFEVEIRHEIVKDPGGPRWHADKIDMVAKCRQDFLGEANGALFMVDTDLILGPGVLERMLAVDADVVYGVFWTHADWGGSMADWPQVWDVNPYGWTPGTAAALKAPGVNEVPVLGGGACTLIRGRGFESRYWPLLESLRRLPGMWGGEDRSYCIGLEARGIKQVAVTGLPVHHCYTLADQTRPALKRIKQEVGL